MQTNRYITKTPLSSKGFKGTVLYLTRQYFTLVGNDFTNEIHLSTIKSMYLDSRIMLFPVVAGGIVTPLSLISLFQRIGDPWLFLFLSILGLMGIYFGMAGQSCLVVNKNHGESVYFVNDYHPDLQIFCDFMNFYVHTDQLQNALYIQMPHTLQQGEDYEIQGDEIVYLGKNNIPAEIEPSNHIYCIRNPIDYSLNLQIIGFDKGVFSVKVTGNIPNDGLIQYI